MSARANRSPFKTAEFDIIFGKGISKESELVDLGVQFEIIEKSGSWFSYGGQRLAQGRDNVRVLLTEDKALAAEIEEKIRKAYAASRNGYEAEFGETEASDDESFDDEP